MDGEKFRLLCYLNTELWSTKFIELDVCGRPLFANPVTYIEEMGTAGKGSVIETYMYVANINFSKSGVREKSLYKDQDTLIE